MTSKDENDKTVSIKVKSKYNLKGDDPNEDSIHGRDLIEPAFSSEYMAEYIEIFEKDPYIQNEISQTINEYNKESFPTRSQIGQNALIQSKVFEQAINIMGETISDIDIELEPKENNTTIFRRYRNTRF